ncbi:putative RNA recognition motif domain, nucleotide-binding alpha-beta plait domain superfamily [Helianthus annuus]|uniref:RNA recognition motif domain, nucleotide-binding alpha-beta plait domain superfamily n=1 Tax=Helianthus annuus TaxID=4232 RepID=A0A9K3GWX3_HELAN|nr:putative RNA recognition motif domain, nucleotide-binding alpha-beta plait domain superfamily [Helianthus annuus]KAJ0441665.1 putative RNA recognition motif domain, nucleotide-binding alpha-beta plait domain superfamily [Helianthus annuus]KAJ0459593.1 putative RNA recognition motif domain, nucleotide-binding alpha-beta plait domain superfamily [Helianthus annuus]KAJ0638503.1 putative RNA recognition motif domain, nucleotide-binding alpha-beta plait domain superfamily [Helianthus annuus]KAJ06
MEPDDEPWEVQNRKKRGNGSYAGINSGVTNFFVTNIPNGCRPWDLANAFRGFGDLSGAFIAKKKDKEGRIFGFISFRGVRDLDEFKRSVSNVKLEGNKLLVNVALFAKENANVKPVVANGGGAKSMGSGSGRTQEGAHQVRGSQAVKNGASFLDILTNRSRVSSDDDVLVVDPAISSLSGFSGRAVVGRSLGLLELRSIKSSLALAGYVGASVQYLGGLSVFVSFENEDLSSKFVQEKDTWSQWFS